MHYLQLILNDIFLSPLIYHVAALLISNGKSLWMKFFHPMQMIARVGIRQRW